MLNRRGNRLLFRSFCFLSGARALHLVLLIFFMPGISKSQFRFGRINSKMIQSQPNVREAMLSYGERHNLDVLYAKRALLGDYHESISDLLLTNVGQLFTATKQPRILLYDEFALSMTQQPKMVSRWLSTRHLLGVRIVRFTAPPGESLLHWRPAQLRRFLDERMIFDLGGLTHGQQSALVEAMNGRLKGFLIVKTLSSQTITSLEEHAQQEQALNVRCLLKNHGAVWLFLPADLGFWGGADKNRQRLPSKVYAAFNALGCANHRSQNSWRDSIDFGIGGVPTSVLKAWKASDSRANAAADATRGHEIPLERGTVVVSGAFWGEAVKKLLLAQLPGVLPATALYPAADHEVSSNRAIQFEWSASKVRAPRHQIDRIQPVRRFRIEIERKINGYFRPFISEVFRVKRTMIKTLAAGHYRWRVKSICDQNICAVSPWSDFNVLSR